MSEKPTRTADELIALAERAYRNAPSVYWGVVAVLQAVGVLDENGKLIPIARLDDIPEAGEDYFRNAALKVPGGDERGVPWCEHCQSYHGPQARHIERKTALDPKEPIPEGYYWAGESIGFICPDNGGLVPDGFDEKWHSRASEFPLWITEACEAHERKAPRPPIPEGVYWKKGHGQRFASMATHEEMSEGFHRQWIDRKAEFPTDYDMQDRYDKARKAEAEEGGGDRLRHSHARAGEAGRWPDEFMAGKSPVERAAASFKSQTVEGVGLFRHFDDAELEAQRLKSLYSGTADFPSERIKGKRTATMRCEGGRELFDKVVGGHLLRLDCDGRRYHCTEARWLKGGRFVFDFEEEPAASNRWGADI